MTTLSHEIANRLASSAALTTPAGSGGLGFAIYEHWLTADGPGSTPSAFDATRGNRLKRSIVVLDGGESAFPGRQPGLDFRRWQSFPTTHIFSEAHITGKEAAHAAYLQIEALLLKWDTIVAGQRIQMRTESRLDLEDSDAFPGNVVIVARWHAVGVRTLVPAA